MKDGGVGKEEVRRGREEDLREERGIRRANDRGEEGIVTGCHKRWKSYMFCTVVAYIRLANGNYVLEWWRGGRVVDR